MSDISKLDKIERLFNILNEAKEIIADLEGYTITKEKKAKTIEQILAKDIRKVALSVRSINVLLMNNITAVGDVIKFTKNELLEFRSCGPVGAEEIENFLNSLGLKLASETDDE